MYSMVVNKFKLPYTGFAVSVRTVRTADYNVSGHTDYRNVGDIRIV